MTIVVPDCIPGTEMVPHFGRWTPTKAVESNIIWTFKTNIFDNDF